MNFVAIAIISWFAVGFFFAAFYIRKGNGGSSLLCIPFGFFCIFAFLGELVADRANKLAEENQKFFIEQSKKPRVVYEGEIKISKNCITQVITPVYDASRSYAQVVYIDDHITSILVTLSKDDSATQFEVRAIQEKPHDITCRVKLIELPKDILL